MGKNTAKIAMNYMDKSYLKGLKHSLILINRHVPIEHTKIREELERLIRKQEKELSL